jgi:hypothetical protein
MQMSAAEASCCRFIPPRAEGVLFCIVRVGVSSILRDLRHGTPKFRRLKDLYMTTRAEGLCHSCKIFDIKSGRTALDVYLGAAFTCVPYACL